MHILLEEAFSLIDSWKNGNTTLQLSLTRSGQNIRGDATVQARTGASLELSVNGQQIELDLSGAEFNGDPRGRPAYLVCEYRNGDMCSLYAPKAAQSSSANRVPG